MFSKNRYPFLLALGAFLIAISPLYGNPYFNIISGLALILLSVGLSKRK